MFQLDPPSVLEFIRGSTLLPLEERERILLLKKRIVVVAVFGRSNFNLSGYKRAFQLSIDCFGNNQLFKEDTNKTTCLDTHTNFKTSSSSTSPVLFPDTQDPPEEDVSLQSGGDFTGHGLSQSQVAQGDEHSNSKDFRGNEGQGESRSNGERDVDADNFGGIDGFYCENEGILFLHLDGAYDPKLCMEAGKELHQAIQETGFIPIWSTLKSKYCRCLLLMFSLSHVLILSDIGVSLDSSYLHLFRVLDAVRLEIKPAIAKALEQIPNIPKDWISHGRLCSPRLLFQFEIESDCPIRKKTPATLQKCPLKEKQMQLEDEIYHILRKCRIITNISANSLFAIPSEDEYIFLYDKSVQHSPYQDESLSYIYFEIIHKACSSVRSNGYKTSGPHVAHRSSSGLSVKNPFRSDPEVMTYSDTMYKFKDFIMTHTRVAHEKGFDDDSKRVAGYRHFFVVPTIQQWEAAFRALSDCLLCSQISDRFVNEGLLQLKKFINIDSEYLEIQCASVFPKIYAAYQRGLPEFYSEQLHQTRLTYAMNAYLNISRGPGVLPWLKKLAEKCERYWKRGRQQCEIKSMFQHSCSNPMHRVRVEDSLEIFAISELDPKLPEMTHNTGNRLISYCNCSRRQGTRDEPFTIKQANHTFYQRLGKDCCERLEKYEFSVFKPADDSTNELSIQEMLRILKNKSGLDTEDNCSVPAALNMRLSDSSQVMETELRQENILEDEGSDGSQNEQENQVDTDLILEDTNEIQSRFEKLAVTDEDEDKTVIRSTQASPYLDFLESSHSNIEYLPGMLHSKTPPGLLPLFPSWSLVCLGPSSLYNHSSGVMPKQGFLNGTNFLLPWDVTVKAEAGVSKPVPRFIRGKRPLHGRAKPITDEFSVKVFIGLEYECHRGHRFFASDFEKIVYIQGGNMGSLKEVGAKVATSDMPLYFKCPCKESRDGTTMIAQLLRIHIVTPKAPVNCIISPRVQPGPPPCPVFFSGNTEPIKLNPSSYWVFRLPYCYVGEEVYIQPSDADITKSNGKLLKGTFTVKAMTPTETKTWERQNLT